ncbi:hypothetical protein DBV05_g1461 [Lasiodiplodia theobromae]|uniref:PXA domain-containing protein n=1 Tax=Lasiodiplodia theobromae TaxID=45133 RepID=A0A5N5DPY5_9PEZI|nr:hypothetical protein DBV05_g1461 [Lasiodiplodia theobromae]
MSTSTDQSPAQPPSDSPQPAHDDTSHAAPADAVDPPAGDMPPSPPPPPVNLQALTDRALKFLSTATNETLGACLVGLGATTYLVLGRVGLVLIGVVGGIVLHAQWEGSLHGFPDDATRAAEDRRRKEIGLDIIKRVMDVRAQSKDAQSSRRRDSDVDIQLFSGKQLDYSAFQPETSAALTDLTDAIVRDYINHWYGPIVPAEMAFPNACRQTLTAFILSVSNHLARKRPADFFLEYLTNSSAIMIVFLNELSDAIGSSPSSTAVEAVQSYLRLKPESKLANVLDRKHQEKKFDAVAEDILENYLEPKTYNCKPARIFLRQILARVVFEMALTTMSKPEWINGWIVYMLEEGEPELMKEIDAGVEGSKGNKLEDVKSQVEAAETVEKEHAGGAQTNATHRRVVSKAQEAMDEAMKEAQRLTQMIQEEEAAKPRDKDETKLDRKKSTSGLSDEVSDGTTQEAFTPTSSQSDQNEERTQSLHDSVIGKTSLQESSKVRDPTSDSVRKSSSDEEKSPKSTSTAPKQAFTSFDQIVTSPTPTALGGRPQSVSKPPPLTLHNASISMFDDSLPGDKSIVKSKPVGDYFVQIEPAIHAYSGWMISRKYADFETLHEVLRRISVVSGVGFTESHPSLPAWKGHTKNSLRGELERYLNDAVRWQPLAESEGLKRFLEKDTGIPGVNKGFGWPTPSAFEQMGKGMFDTLSKAPNQAAAGGKAIFGGVTGVFGSLGPKRKSMANPPTNSNKAEEAPATSRHRRAESTVSELPNSSHLRSESILSTSGRRSTDSVRSPVGRRSQESIRSLPVVDQQPAPIAQMERRPSYNPEDTENKPRPNSSRSSVYGSRTHSRNPSRAPSQRESLDISPLMGGDQILNLPPPPSDISDSYGEPPSPERERKRGSRSEESRRLSRASTARESMLSESGRGVSPPKFTRAQTDPGKARAESKLKAPLNENETQMAVELFFAIINELYTLSSAWQIRKTLLGAAKTFLLRPGNPQLESIRVLLQDTVLEANSSDAGIASHLQKLRFNTMPTEEERKKWPVPMSDEEKEKLRVKARKLLVERGMPQALTSVMGQAASGEALGKVFDCLQVEDVSRGFMFGLLLQAVRAVTA